MSISQISFLSPIVNPPAPQSSNRAFYFGSTDAPRAFNRSLYTFGVAGAPEGYATAEEAIRSLATATAGDAHPATVVYAKGVHAGSTGGRYYGHWVGQGGSWLGDYVMNLSPLRSAILEPFAPSADTAINFKSNDIVALVDGDVVIRNERVPTA